MRLELTPRLFQGIKCRACDGFMHEHEGDCPQEKLTRFCQEAALREYHCPKCHGNVALNKADFYECRKCRTQFATGEACGEDASTLERSHLMNDDVAISVIVMTYKGRGKFRDDEIIRSIRAEVAQARRERGSRK